MPRPIPVDLILHTLVESLLELPEDHLRDLARAISARCIDPRLVADQWCDGAGVTQSADWIVRRLMGAKHHTPIPQQRVGAETRTMEVAIARRLADAGLALLVTQDAEDRATATLLLDASRLVVGLLGTPPTYCITGDKVSMVQDEGRLAVEFLSSWKHDDAPHAGLTLSQAVRRMATQIENLVEVNTFHCRDIAAKDAVINAWEEWAKTVAGIEPGTTASTSKLRATIYKRITDTETPLTNDLKRARDDLDIWRSWGAKLGEVSVEYGGLDIRDAVEKRIIAAETAPRPAHESLVASLRAELDGARHDMKNADAEIVVWKAERDAAIAEMVAIRAELDEARDCARREVVWAPKDKANRPTFKPGDRVVVARKADSKSCPWSNSDDEYLGRTAEVLRVDGVGDVFVAIYDDRAWFAPACLDPAPPDTRTMRERLIDRGLDPATIDAALETKLPQFIAPAEETERPQFKVGDRVRFKPQTKTGEHPSHGDEGCIDRVDDADSRLPFRVKWFALSNFATWHRPGHLTLITPTA